jgi:hypothetical protein
MEFTPTPYFSSYFSLNSAAMLVQSCSSPSGTSLRIYERNARKIVAVTATVARENAAAKHGGVGTDEEIRKNIGFRATLTPVFHEGAPCQKQRRAR